MCMCPRVKDLHFFSSPLLCSWTQYGAQGVSTPHGVGHTNDAVRTDLLSVRQWCVFCSAIRCRLATVRGSARKTKRIYLSSTRYEYHPTATVFIQLRWEGGVRYHIDCVSECREMVIGSWWRRRRRHEYEMNRWYGYGMSFVIQLWKGGEEDEVNEEGRKRLKTKCD